MHRKSLLFMS
uniref:Uncharacterized protein n=1 Tax=Rhizophora mucronata TaxID=61149 RepID=A0A2P2N5R8_RHIMU